jgi:hypothetical protein
MKINYQKFIESRLKIVNKNGEVVPFILNTIQKKYQERKTGKDIILKARQQGFSSLILGEFTADFLLNDNSYSVVVADNSDNATGLLARVKYFLKSYEEITGIKVPLKYNSKYELFNESINSRYIIGTAENTEFGRSKTITNLHFSEAAFYKHFRKLLASALQALTPTGRCVIETTACGFNEFKEFWDESEMNETGFQPLFFKASDFYDADFLSQKEGELKRLFKQEYPETAIEAFLTSGDCYFSNEALEQYLVNVKQAINFQFV